MKKIEITLYSFDELSEQAQQKVLNEFAYFNVEDSDWWENIYEDAKNIGLIISEFDIDRENFCKGKFDWSSLKTANLIISEHGETCETYKTAQTFLAEYQSEKKHFESNPKNNECDFEDESSFEDMENNFLYSLCEDYKILLKHEFEYLTSKESIIETIEAKEYTFTEDGKLYNS